MERFRSAMQPAYPVAAHLSPGLLLTDAPDLTAGRPSACYSLDDDSSWRPGRRISFGTPGTRRMEGGRGRDEGAHLHAMDSDPVCLAAFCLVHKSAGPVLTFH